MPLFKFDDFIFDSSSHKLSYKGTKVDIRPKALKLLSLLIHNKHRVLSKAEIMSSVWACDYARDHLLFQLVSELRKLPLKSEFVRTLPNEGYQWNVSTKTVDNRFFVPKLITAGFAAALASLLIIALPILNETDISPSDFLQNKQTGQLPAYTALSKGIIALENGRKNEAIQWFEFALSENPGSVESSIFLAETLYQQDRHEESAKHLHSVLDKNDVSAYSRATASNILSRISEQQGQLENALKHALEAGQTEELEQCSANFVVQRIQKLENRIAMAPKQPDLTMPSANESALSSHNYAKQCDELKTTNSETLSCLRLMSQSIAFIPSLTTAKFRTS